MLIPSAMLWAHPCNNCLGTCYYYYYDLDNDGKLGLIGFERIQGGKHFDHSADWFQAIKDDIE